MSGDGVLRTAVGVGMAAIGAGLFYKYISPRPLQLNPLLTPFATSDPTLSADWEKLWQTAGDGTTRLPKGKLFDIAGTHRHLKEVL